MRPSPPGRIGLALCNSRKTRLSSGDLTGGAEIRDRPFQFRVLRIRMSSVPPEAFREPNACAVSVFLRPLLHLTEVVVHPVLPLKPAPLAGMAGEHATLRVHY